MYFDEMIRKELVKTSEFSEMKSTDEIIENQGEYAESVRGRDGLYEGISESHIRSDEAGVSFKQRGAESLRDVIGSIQGEEADQIPNGYSETGDRVYESREAETDDGLEDRGREPSAVQSDDFSPQRNDNQEVVEI
ncbi:hypothetical protein KK420_06580 [Clostridioides difficile]|nr:hypothetical protein [Clostridioides difficile]